jgi:hypothetical protein
MLGALATLLCLLAPTPAGADDFYGITPDDRLVRFDALDHTLRAPVALAGLASAEHVVAIDVRPATGGLYGIAQKGAAIRLVRIDQATGALTAVGSGVGMFSAPAGVGMDVDPDDDAVVVVADNDQAVRFNPATGVPTVLPGPSPATPQFVALAYTPEDNSGSFPFAVDRAADELVLGSGSGTYADIFGPLGVDVTGNASLDMGPNTTLWMHVVNANRMYRIATTSGEASEAGSIAPLQAVAIRLTGGIGFGSGTVGAAEGDGTAAITLQRAAPAEGIAKVRWSTADGTAAAGADYTAASGEVTFARGESSKTVSVPLLQDAAAEGTERVTLHLDAVDGVPAGPDAQLVIADDDQPAAPGPPPDTAPVLLALPVKLAAKRSLELPFALSEASRVTVTLRLTKQRAKRLELSTELATAELDGVPGDNAAVLKLSKKEARKLHARSSTKATAVIVATDAAGNRATRTMKVTLT